MKVMIALLRGINVGGRNRLPMRDLIEILEGLGVANIQTYIQSGNVVFESEATDPAALAPKISTAIRQSHGFEPAVLILGLEELEAAVQANPFPEAETEPKTLHLYFLTTEPQDPKLDILEALRRERECFALRGKTFYLHAPDGIGRSRLAERVEKALGVPVTARNWRTVQNVLALASP